ncbi:MAG: hypothetical protein ABJH63_02790 [Rhizobiaceae bacterium]
MAEPPNAERDEVPWGFSARDFVLIVGAALIVRWLNLSLLPSDVGYYSFPDSSDYLAMARHWDQQGTIFNWLQATGRLSTERMPGYAWFLYALAEMGFDSPRWIAFAQSLVDSLTCGCVGVLGAQISTKLGRLSGILAAFSPTLIIHSTLILQDTLFVFMMTACLMLALVAAKSGSLAAAFVCGLLFGLAFFVRSVLQYMLILLPVCYLAIVLCSRFYAPAKPLAKLGLATLLGISILLAPLAYRGVSLGSIYPTTQSGLHALFWTVNLVHRSETGRTFAEQSPFTRKIANDEFNRLSLDEVDLGAFEVDKIYRDIAFKELLNASPVTLAKVWIQGVIVSLVSPGLLSDGRVRQLERPSFYKTPGNSFPERAYKYFFDDPKMFQVIILLAGVFCALFAFLLVIGLVNLVIRVPLVALAGVVFISYFLLLSGPTSGPKYRMPYMPLLIVFAAAGILAVWEFTKTKVLKPRRQI